MMLQAAVFFKDWKRYLKQKTFGNTEQFVHLYLSMFNF